MGTPRYLTSVFIRFPASWLAGVLNLFGRFAPIVGQALSPANRALTKPGTWIL
jgi:hypothetical protein